MNKDGTAYNVDTSNRTMTSKASPLTLFLMPLAVLSVTRFGIELAVRLLPLHLSWIPAFLLYYGCIEACVIYGRRTLGINATAGIFRIAPPPNWKRLGYGVILPALLPLGFFLLNIKAVPVSFVVLIVVFALVNPYFEEIFWRGLLSNVSSNRTITILFSASLFSFSHYFLWGAYWLADPPAKWIATCITTFIMGILWMLFYLNERKLFYPTLSHVFVDIFNLSVAMFYGIKLTTI